MSQQLVTGNFRLHTAKQFVESIDEDANTAYYVFFGNHLEYANANSIPVVYDNLNDTEIDVYRNMIFAKRVASSDVSLMIERNDYVSNKVYDMYDDQANTLVFDKNYYAVVNADSFYHVFKCLDNNGGTNSTIEPNFSDVDLEDRVYETSDGYVWKYMYSVSDTKVSKFATLDWFPVEANTAVEAAASGGTIDIVKVVLAGSGYDNYTNGTFTVNDIRLGGNTLLYSLNQSSDASLLEDFYTGCYLTIVSGSGVGQSIKIASYTVNSTYKTVQLVSSFTTPPMGDSVYEVTPSVTIVGDGTETLQATGRAIVNSIGNTIHKVEMIDVGSGYSYANATVVASTTVGVTTEAILRPILLPFGGHSSDAAAELGARAVGVSINVANTDVDIPLTNDYRTIGLLKDPIFSRMTINFTEANSILRAGEPFYKVSPILVATGAEVTVSSSNLVCANADFTNQFTAGDPLYIKGQNRHQIAIVNSVINSSVITLNDTALFTCSAANVYITNLKSEITNVSFTTTTLTGNVSVNTTSPNMVGSGTTFTTDLVANSSVVFLSTNSAGGGVFRKVVSITNNTLAVLESNSSFANSTAKASLIDYHINTDVRPGTNGITGWVDSVTISSFVATNVTTELQTGDILIGGNTGARVIVSSTERQGVAKGSDTFIQMFKYVGEVISGEFIEDEIVYQDAIALSNAALHSVVNDSIIYVTNQLGIFNEGGTITGSNSSAVATITEKYEPEVIFGSGKVLYLENIDAVSRNSATRDIVKFVFEC